MTSDQQNTASDTYGALSDVGTTLEEAILQKHFKDEWVKASLNVVYTGGWLRSRTADFLKPFDLTAQQYNVLRILRGQHPHGITTLEIRRRLLDKMADTSRMVDRLERDGWVHKNKDPEDKRLVEVRISDKGLNILSIIDGHLDHLNRCMYRLDAQEAAELNRLLDKIRCG
ncbi:MarR family transcriptional regulator [bacterium]|nr:MarR family transcriptional regulator [bacterium]